MRAGYLFTVLGLICFLEGLPYLASPDHLKKWLQEVVIRASNRNLRFFGGGLMVVGLLLVYWGRQYGG
jgi:uncharacterized protein